MPQPGGWIPPCSGISRELGRTLPTAGFCNGHSSHIVQTTGAAARGRRPQENEIRPTRAASETREECGFLLRSWMSPTEHFPWVSSQILKRAHFGCACASFVFIFHGHSVEIYTHEPLQKMDLKLDGLSTHRETIKEVRQWPKLLFVAQTKCK